MWLFPLSPESPDAAFESIDKALSILTKGFSDERKVQLFEMLAEHYGQLADQFSEEDPNIIDSVQYESGVVIVEDQDSATIIVNGQPYSPEDALELNATILWAYNRVARETEPTVLESTDQAVVDPAPEHQS